MDFISPNLFWDVKFESIDVHRDRNLVIQRVVDYGTFEQFLLMLKFYGKNLVKNEVVENNELSEKSMYFLATYLDIKPEDFKCFSIKQSNQTLFHY
ncbi:MAG: hypothetical protein RJQ09_19180 [Cyclobacteriaceae bacterium]